MPVLRLRIESVLPLLWGCFFYVFHVEPRHSWEGYPNIWGNILKTKSCILIDGSSERRSIMLNPFCTRIRILQGNSRPLLLWMVMRRTTLSASLTTLARAYLGCYRASFPQAQESKESTEARGLMARKLRSYKAEHIRTANETIRHGAYIVYIILGFVNIP